MFDELLLQTVRVLGIVLGVAGTVIVSEEAARAAVRAPWRLVKAAWVRLQVWRGKRIRPLSPGGAADLPLISSGEFKVGLQPWPEDSGSDLQIEVLRLRSEALDAALKHMSAANQSMIDDLRADVRHRFDEHERARMDLIEHLQHQRRTNLAVNVRGVPLLGWSVVLSGIPDAVLSSPVSAVLICISALLSIGTIWSERFERYVGRTPVLD